MFLIASLSAAIPPTLAAIPLSKPRQGRRESTWAQRSTVEPGPALRLYWAGWGYQRLYWAGWGCQPGGVRPRIRYCATPAGRVAYSASGSGPALLLDSGWVSHLYGQLELYSFGDFAGRLAEGFTVIRYDKPGCGLSDRDGIDLSFDGQVAAALAVADEVGAGRFCLFGASQGGQVAAAIAARYPDRVEALVLYGTCACGSDLAPTEIRNSVVALVRAHWGLGLRALAGAFVTDPTTEEVAAFTRAQRAGASAAVAARLLEVYYGTDIRALLPAIRARTAVLHREADQGTRFELGREVAALIPGATLTPLPGSSHLFYHGDWQAVADAALGFLREPGSGAPRLTGRELEVAELVAEGLTNQAIARRLSVAPRTAEAHVENIRRKLQVRSRAQIAAWVTGHRLSR
jgi:pimeloyl-ACP methyl ester carboxylesterase/DNA-binding CsgD family transcriptional regulator